MSRRYLITGGAGFIGSNFIEYLFQHEPDCAVTNLDALTHAGVEATVVRLDADPRHTFVKGDIRSLDLVDYLIRDHDVVVNFAAESHVDRSIEGPIPFLDTNVVGTTVLLEAARRHDIPRFVQISTDEVYGSIESGAAVEGDPLAPSSPYSASKAGADLLVQSYGTTFGYPAITTRCTNNYGPGQFPEKLVPLFITNLIDGKPVPLYGDGLHERDWMHVEDHCAAIHLLVDEGTPGEIYNIGAGAQLTNLALTRSLLDIMDMDESVIDFVPDRRGHDRRYSVDSSKLRSLGWLPRADLEGRLAETVAWYRAHEAWWRPLLERRPMRQWPGEMGPADQDRGAG